MMVYCQIKLQDDQDCYQKAMMVIRMIRMVIILVWMVNMIKRLNVFDLWSYA